MAIRFVNDAAAVVIPPNQSSRKYGQQLVQQQQKYANDQRQLQQENMYDRQKEYRQTAFQLQKAQTDRFVDAQRIKDQQAFAEKMQQNALDAQDKRAQQEMQLRARQQEMQRIDQLKKQQQMDDFDGINSGEFDPKVASRMKELWRRKNEIPMDKNLDEGMRAEESDKIEEELSGLRGNRIQAPSGAERANRNLSHYVPSLQKYATPEELQELRKADPNIEVQVFQDGKMLPGPTPKQGPMTAQDYYRADDAKFNKDLSSKMSELQDKLDAGEMTLQEGQDLRSVAWQQMQDDYDFKQKALGGGQPAQGGQPAAPPQAGQPAMPPAQAPAAPPPAMGMQDLEPTYNADRTTSVPGQQAMTTDATGQQANLQRDLDALRELETGVPTTAEQPAATLPVDQTGMQPPPLPNEQEILSELFPQGVPADANQSPINRDLALAPAHPDYKAPPTPTGQKDANGYVVMSDGSKVDPRDFAAMKSGGAITQDVMRRTNPDGSKKEPSSGGVISLEAINTFESGTPEQQMELRKKLKSSPDGIAGLVAEAANNNPDAIKALDLLEKSIPLAEALQNKAKKGKLSDINAAIGELQSRRKLGEIDDNEFVSSVISASGKTSKQIYGEMRPIPKDGNIPQESMTLNAIWDEMGMFDSRPHVRAFQKTPTMQEVISHAATKGKMSREAAEEWVYSQILGRKYANKIQKTFESKIAGSADSRRDKKHDEKRDAWKPN